MFHVSCSKLAWDLERGTTTIVPPAVFLSLLAEDRESGIRGLGNQVTAEGPDSLIS